MTYKTVTYYQHSIDMSEAKKSELADVSSIRPVSAVVTCRSSALDMPETQPLKTETPYQEDHRPTAAPFGREYPLGHFPLYCYWSPYGVAVEGRVGRVHKLKDHYSQLTLYNKAWIWRLASNCVFILEFIGHSFYLSM